MLIASFVPYLYSNQCKRTLETLQKHPFPSPKSQKTLPIPHQTTTVVQTNKISNTLEILNGTNKQTTLNNSSQKLLIKNHKNQTIIKLNIINHTIDRKRIVYKFNIHINKCTPLILLKHLTPFNVFPSFTKRFLFHKHVIHVHFLFVLSKTMIIFLSWFCCFLNLLILLLQMFYFSPSLSLSNNFSLLLF